MRILIFLALWACKPFASELPNCSTNELFTGKLFELEVRTSFQGRYLFKFCFDSSSYLLSEYHEPVYLTKSVDTTIVNESKVKLPEGVANLIKELYAEAQTNLKADSAHGLDGQTWCFRPKDAMSYAETCIWSPQASTTSRGHEKLVELGEYLYKISSF